MARFAYYDGLDRAQKATYRRSDGVAELPVPDPAPLRRYATQIEDALSRDDLVALEQAAGRLASHLTILLEIHPVAVRVFATRPRSAQEELHGLYVREEGRKAVIHVWMRTAARGDVVRFKTFLRTLVHELCHHVDYELLGLDDSFHTRGFFRRESHLLKQILPRRGRLGRAAKGAVAVVPPPIVAPPPPSLVAQLELPLGPSGRAPRRPPGKA